MSTRKKKATRRPSRAASDKERGVTLLSLMKSSLRGLLITAGVGLLLLLSFAALLLNTKDPNRYYTAVSTVLLYVCALLCGALTTRLYRRRVPLLCGLCSGALLLSLLLALRAVMPTAESSFSAPLSLGLYALILPTATLGALLSAKKPKARRRRHA